MELFIWLIFPMGRNIEIIGRKENLLNSGKFYSTTIGGTKDEKGDEVLLRRRNGKTRSEITV